MQFVSYGNTLISYDPNLRLSLWQDEKTARAAIIDEIPKADIIKVNNEELFFLFEKEDYNNFWKMP